MRRKKMDHEIRTITYKSPARNEWSVILRISKESIGSCFYIESLANIEGKDNLGIENQVPPDLIIEVNRKSSSVPRMPIFAAFGVKEIWRLSNDEVRFYTLEEGVYLETENSVALPILSSQKATEFLQDSQKSGNVAWATKIKNWVTEVK